MQDKVTVKHNIKVEDPNMITLETPWGYQEVPLYGNFPSPMGELDPINQEHQVDISPDGWRYQDDASQGGGGGGGGGGGQQLDQNAMPDQGGQ